MTNDFGARVIRLFLPVIALLGTCGLLAGCNGGLEPPAAGGPVELSGTVHYTHGMAHWPPQDSLVSIRVVAFSGEAPGSPEEILNQVLNETAFFTLESLAFYTDSAAFSIVIPEPAPEKISYLVAAQQYGARIDMDWRVIGVYTTSGNQAEPGQIELTPGQNIGDIAIEVDFTNLPPQPF